MRMKQLWNSMSPDVLNFLLRRRVVRGALLKRAERQLHKEFVVLNKDNRPRRIQEGRCLMLKNLLQAVDRAISDKRLSPKVSRSLIANFAGRVLMAESTVTMNFEERYGFSPPAFLTISPTKKCNLMCKGCYAASSSGAAETLSYETFNRILKEKSTRWGSYFTVISGGEPLLYSSRGKSLFDILEENHDNYFMIYTNGTLITEAVAEKMAELGNITPAISVEGFETETDGRRGNGTFTRIMKAMDNLKKAGVPFGVSITATRNNADIVVSDKFMDYYFGDKGAVYGWIFQYMPIGRSYTVDLMLTPEQRLELFKKEQEIIKEKNIFFVDFWNGGPYAVGCISAGRPGGYFYIDWNGNVSPCVFFPYAIDNIYSVYEQGRSLDDVLMNPMFKNIREWQNEYGYMQPPERVDNYIVPCPMRDHYDTAYTLIKQFGAKPMDQNAASALEDADYRQKLAEHGRRTKALTQEFWESEFLNPEK
jgi:MoaA/NifB/PqqE/SkfB family radical SAM enzyme